MIPNTKRLLATLVVAIVGAVLPILTQTGTEALPALAAVIGSVSLSFAYYVRAWGTKEGVIDELLKAPEKNALDEDVDFPEDEDTDEDEDEDEDEDTDPGYEPRT